MLLETFTLAGVFLLNRVLKYKQAIKEGINQCMERDASVFVIGLGVPDPGGVFGTTLGLQDKYGTARVFDMPLAENAMTGVLLGAAMTGMRPVMTHQRVDFAITSFEQIINQAAKWCYMFDGQVSIPLVIRMVIGRGWGQGPQPSQSLQATFAHVPGLKVVMPSTPYDAKGMMISAIEDNNPVIILEHRWLYDLEDNVPENFYKVPIGTGKIMRSGLDITLVGVSYMSIECLRAADLLAEYGVSAEVIDLRSVRPFDEELLINSIKKTGRMIVADTAHKSFGVSAELMAVVTEKVFASLRTAPARVGLPDYPTPTSHALSRDYYPVAKDIVLAVLNMMGFQPKKNEDMMPPTVNLDQPDRTFTGPF